VFGSTITKVFELRGSVLVKTRRVAGKEKFGKDGVRALKERTSSEKREAAAESEELVEGVHEVEATRTRESWLCSYQMEMCIVFSVCGKQVNKCKQSDK
jgi:hypothetical protein